MGDADGGRDFAGSSEDLYLREIANKRGFIKSRYLYTPVLSQQERCTQLY